jgi:hypothetical protein
MSSSSSWQRGQVAVTSWLLNLLWLHWSIYVPVSNLALIPPLRTSFMLFWTAVQILWTLPMDKIAVSQNTILSLCYSRFEVTWLLRANSNSKTHVRFVYILPEVLHSDFFIWNKIFIQPKVKYFTYILTRNVIFFYDYSNWGELSFNIFMFFT